MYNSILTTDQARVFSTSWGGEENLIWDASSMDTAHSIFNQMVGQGWTLVAASGDQGATAGCCTDADAVQYPASDLDVIAAGGTALESFNGTYYSEVGWTGLTAPGSCANNHGGSTGGDSAYYTAPSYQANIPYNIGARSVPDIALNASWGQDVYFNGVLTGYTGTSIVAPELTRFFCPGKRLSALSGQHLRQQWSQPMRTDGQRQLLLLSFSV
jgi:subtilase family serine protease